MVTHKFWVLNARLTGRSTDESTNISLGFCLWTTSTKKIIRLSEIFGISNERFLICIIVSLLSYTHILIKWLLPVIPNFNIITYHPGTVLIQTNNLLNVFLLPDENSIQSIPQTFCQISNIILKLNLPTLELSEAIYNFHSQYFITLTVSYCHNYSGDLS